MSKEEAGIGNHLLNTTYMTADGLRYQTLLYNGSPIT